MCFKEKTKQWHWHAQKYTCCRLCREKWPEIRRTWMFIGMQSVFYWSIQICNANVFQRIVVTLEMRKKTINWTLLFVNTALCVSSQLHALTLVVCNCDMQALRWRNRQGLKWSLINGYTSVVLLTIIWLGCRERERGGTGSRVVRERAYHNTHTKHRKFWGQTKKTRRHTEKLPTLSLFIPKWTQI